MNFKIGNKIIGPDKPTFIVAEMSANHSRQIKYAYKIIDYAKKIGVDAIKIQLYKADKITA